MNLRVSFGMQAQIPTSFDQIIKPFPYSSHVNMVLNKTNQHLLCRSGNLANIPGIRLHLAPSETSSLLNDRDFFCRRCADIFSGKSTDNIADLKKELTENPNTILSLIEKHHQNPFPTEARRCLEYIVNYNYDPLFDKGFSNNLTNNEKRIVWDFALKSASEGRLLNEYLKQVFRGDLDFLCLPETYPGESMQERVLRLLLSLNSGQARRGALATFLVSKSNYDAVAASLSLDQFTWKNGKAYAACFSSPEGRDLRLVDIHDNRLIFYSPEEGLILYKKEAGALVVDTSDLVFEDVFQSEGRGYFRIDIPGSSDIYLGLAKVDDSHCWDRRFDPFMMQICPEEFHVFHHQNGRMCKMTDLSSIRISHTNGITKAWDPDQTPIISAFNEISSIVYPNGFDEAPGHTFITRRFHIHGNRGESWYVDITEPNWSDTANVAAQNPNYCPLRADQLMLFLIGKPFQIFRGFDSDNIPHLKLIPEGGRGQQADASGMIFAKLFSEWTAEDVTKIIVHEWLGHLTHLGNEDILFPIMMLFAKLSNYRPISDYGMTNGSEFWAVSHEAPYTHPDYIEQYPLMMALLRSVYTQDGSHFETESVHSLSDLGFSLSVSR